ncbi:DNA translocase FtsK [Vibrio olivae]|uniref:DNA translocase FtsK n=1 Tax=Vibrio olivae TaxID=1243002 RepID=A0ABV5HLR7_9VIBR
MFKENKSKVETIIKTGEESSSSRLSGTQRLRECALIVAVLFSILLAVSLVTYSPADPSWSQTAWGVDIENAGGIVGAWIADTLFFTFGSLAYPIPVILTCAAWVLFRKRDEDEPLNLMLWGTRLLGLCVLILTSCGLADINFDDIWYFSSGGVIGDVLTSLALPTLNVLGTTLVLLFMWGAGFTLLTGISWLDIVDGLGSLSLRLMTGLLNKLRGRQDETLEPSLTSTIAERKTLAAEDFVASRDVDAQTHSEPSPLASETATDEPVSNEPPQARRFNIHVPDSRSDDPLMAPTASSEPTPEPMYIAQEDEDTFDADERERQLGATIEQLEAAAKTGEHNHEKATSSVAIEQASYSTSADYSSNDEDEDLQTDELPWQVDVEEQYTPALSEEQWSQISQDITPESEPSFSSFEIDEQENDVSTAPAMENDEKDADVEAFQDIVNQAQATQAAQQNPFLAKKEEILPKPAEPMPTLELLYHPEKRENFIDRDALEDIARLVEAKLADYKIKARVVDIFPGPVITRFELDLAPGVKVSRISGLSMDLARSLSAMAVRVVEVIPGKPYVGLELPNMSRQTVYLSDVIASCQFKDAKSPTTVVLGQDIAGDAVVADLAKMPHVLVAGTTGSGKSVGVNVMILSMLYKSTPEDVRFIMIDPKMLELSVYEGIPHLLSEVVTDMKDASNALRWCVGEMERRYKLMSALGVRNIKGFNDKLKMAAEAGHPIHDPLWQPGDSMDEEAPLLEKLPYIVVIVDEFADLMMVVGKKVEELIARLAQKARAAGIHLILATQRPSVDVITGLIKANIPTRVAFTVSTKTDSRTILDQGGAESLLGMGDMLYLPPGSSHTVRVHGAFASDDDVHAVVNNWKARGKPNYIDEITNGEQSPETLLPGEKMESDEDVDPLFDQVVEHVVESRRGSVSGVQRRFKIGYNRAARIVEQLEAQGIVSAPGHNGNREVIAPKPNRDMN